MTDKFQSLKTQQVVDEACDRFEQKLRTENPLTIESVLDDVDEQYCSSLFEELLRAEIQVRKERSEDLVAADYLRRFKKYAQTIEAIFDETILPEVQLVTPSSEEHKAKPESGLHVRCPNCHCPIELIEEVEMGSIDCPSCGSNFSLVDDSSNTRHAMSLKEIGHFKVVERVGAGAFGTVWKALDTKLDRTVALKVPRRGQLEPGQEEQFLREARSSAQLNHPHIVSVHEVGRDGDTIYIVSDLVRGVPLSEMIVENRLSQREVVVLTIKLAKALQHAHERGIIHRDLKPQNVMVDDDGEPHLMDFGLAKRDVGEVTMTLDGAVLGTPAYMSPEQARGESHRVDQTSDVYSLGVMLFQLLTGELPFRGSVRMLLHKVINDEAPSPKQFNSNIPRDLETIVLKCLEKDPPRRYQSAIEVCEELERFLAGKPINARPVGSIEKSWRWAKRNATVAGLAGTVALSLIAGTLGASYYAFIADERAQELEKAYVQVKTEKKTAESEKAKSEALESLAETRLDEKVKQTKEASEAIFRIGLTKYSTHRPKDGLEQLTRAWRMREPNDPVKSSYARVLADRLTRGGRSPIVFQCPDRVWSVAFSPDGKRLATASEDHAVRIWDVETGAALGGPVKHNCEIYSVAFSPDGKRLATASADGTARLWDAKTGAPLVTPIRHDGAVTCVAFSPDGERLATASDDKTAHLWNVKTAAPIGQTINHDHSVTCVAFSPDDKRLATASADTTARLWDAETGVPLGEPMEGHSAAVTFVAFSPDGKKLATASDDETARLWNTKDGGPQGSPMRHDSYITGVAFSPDGKLLATACYDCTARLWDVKTRSPVGEPMKHDHHVTCVAFSPDGQQLATASEDNTARLWNFDAEIHLIERKLVSRQSVAFSPDGQRMAVAALIFARLWDMRTGESMGPIIRPGGSIDCVALSPDGKRLATASSNRTVRLWDARIGAPLGKPMKHDHAVTSVALSPDGQLLATASGNTACLWDAHTGERLGNRLTHHGDVWCVAFSPDGKRLATACSAAAPSIDDAHSGFTDKPSYRKPLTAASAYACARLWDVKTLSPVGEPMRHDARVSFVAFSPDSKLLATASWDNTSRLWDVETGIPQGELMRHDQHLKSVAFSPDGKSLATTCEDNTARFWDVKTSASLGAPIRHDDIVRAAAFGPDSEWLATASQNGLVRQWPVPGHMSEEKHVSLIERLAPASLGTRIKGSDYRLDANSAKGPGAVYRYYDESGKPRDTSFGSDIGSIFDIDMDSWLQDTSYPRREIFYTPEGNVFADRYFDPFGNPANCKDGYHGFFAGYDHQGNRIFEQYFGIDKNPTMIPQGYYQRKMSYDAAGNLASERYFDTSGKRTKHVGGYHGFIAEHDYRGNERIRQYIDIDIDETPTMNQFGYSRCEVTYDAAGFKVSERYLDVGGKLLSKLGLRITGVLENSNAERAGLKRSDLIVKYANERIYSSDELIQRADESAEGESTGLVTLLIERDGVELSIQAEKGELGVSTSPFYGPSDEEPVVEPEPSEALQGD